MAWSSWSNRNKSQAIGAAGTPPFRYGHRSSCNKKGSDLSEPLKVAITYSSAFAQYIGTDIGVIRFYFSVHNGKR